MIRADTPAPRGKRKAKIGGPVNADKLEGFVARIENVEKDQKALTDSKRSIYSEAKGVGYNPKAVRKIIKERAAPEPDQVLEETLDTYRHALGMAVAAVESGEMSARQSALAHGVGKSSIYKALSVREVSTVEMTADDLGTAEAVREMVADDLGDPLLVIDRDRGLFREKVRKIAASVKPPKVEAAPAFIENDDLEFPPFLRRTA